MRGKEFFNAEPRYLWMIHKKKKTKWWFLSQWKNVFLELRVIFLHISGKEISNNFILNSKYVGSNFERYKRNPMNRVIHSLAKVFFSETVCSVDIH